MNEKEMNLAILAKLYDAAEDTWKSMKKRGGVKGSYSAKEVLSLVKWEEVELPEEERSYTVTVEGFSCTFTSATVFDLATRFERLCAVKGKAKRLFATAIEESGELVARCTIDESMENLAGFVGKDPIRPVMECVCVDPGKNLAYASDGHILQFHYLNVTSDEEDGKNTHRPLIPAAEWKKMCKAAGGGAELRCRLIGEGCFSRWRCECNGFVSNFPADKAYPNAMNVVEPVSGENLLAITDGDWKGLQKSLKAIKDKEAVAIFRHEEGADTITVTVTKPAKRPVELAVFTCECAATPHGRYFFTANLNRITKVKRFFTFAPTTSPGVLQFHDERGQLTLIVQTPVIGETAYSLPASNTFSPLAFCHSTQKEKSAPEALEEAKEEVKEAVDAAPDVAAVPVDVQPLEGASEEPGECVEVVEPQRAQTTEPPVPTPAVKPRTDDEVKTEPKPEKKKERKEKPAPSLDTDVKKFTLAKVGVNVGETLVFVDGTRVTAAAGNKVEYKGALFTLSGYCKAFMPETKRNKANSYRGCEYFFNVDGVKLGKLFKEYQKSVAAPLEARNEEPGKAVAVDVRPQKAARRTVICKGGEKPVQATETGKKRTWLRRMLGSVHRIAAAFSLL